MAVSDAPMLSNEDAATEHMLKAHKVLEAAGFSRTAAVKTAAKSTLAEAALVMWSGIGSHE
ncbi:hypothetical protein ACHAPT_004093 [Fusarium lateritium]